ncbi:hypothetical protein I551_5182 [Mycobacterium ulcerans str. Harvey]|uniref:Uncharacterized protein n=1 Tax=Mycobacterium ulcerans str. Harvey TaxID=1299332 RepID=A0ABN0QU94_MYCUL|nr:hypothetical protein I551_5182 [Mycobacterium ulcerans str. Harvey]
MDGRSADPAGRRNAAVAALCRRPAQSGASGDTILTRNSAVGPSNALG